MSADHPEQLSCLIRKQAQMRPDATALAAPEATWSYAALDRAVDRIADRLRHEVAPSQGGAGPSAARVALYLPRSATYLVTVWALMRAGLTACPINTRLPVGEIGAYLQRIGACALVATGETLEAVSGRNASTASEAVCAIDMQAVEACIEDTGANRPGRADGAISIRADHPATIIATSGSTGTPKAALHTYGNHYYSADGSNQNIGVEPGDRWMQSLPLYHVGGLAIAFRCWLGGGAVVIPPPDQPLGRAIEACDITHVSMVATQMRRLLHEPAGDVRSLKAVLLGGSAIPEGYLERAHAQGLPIHTSYGLTEMSSQVATTPPGASLRQLRSAGRVLPHRTVDISEDGELRVRGRTLFNGYLDEDAAPKVPTDADGWFHTGDRGYFDEEDSLHIVGRMDRMFISGGENIQPEEIEQALERFGDIEQAAVVPVPNDEYGHRPVAFVRLREGGEMPGDLGARLRRVLAGYKVPNAFHAWPEGLASSRMKIDYDALQAQAQTKHRGQQGGDN